MTHCLSACDAEDVVQHECNVVKRTSDNTNTRGSIFCCRDFFSRCRLQDSGKLCRVVAVPPKPRVKVSLNLSFRFEFLNHWTAASKVATCNCTKGHEAEDVKYCKTYEVTTAQLKMVGFYKARSPEARRAGLCFTTHTWAYA